MSKIHDNNFFYKVILHYMAFFHDSAYRKIEYTGKENIPTNAAIIYAPNHSSALMDALIVLMMNKKPTVFVARGDLFKNPKVDKILRFFKILPIARRRDGLGEVKKNNKTMEECVSVLCNGVPFGIMPEGGQQTKRSLMPLGKGIFRIALDSNELINGEKQLYIVPMGITQGSYFDYRNTMFVEVGKPINVTDFVDKHKDMEKPEQMNLLRKMLKKHMLPQLTYLENDEYYYGSYDLVLIANQIQIIREKGKSKLENRIKACRKVANKIAEYRQESEENSTSLLREANDFYKLRKEIGIMDDTLLKGTSNIKQFGMSLLSIVLFPYFIFTAIISSPIHLLVKYINHLIHDKEFDNTVRFVANLVIYPLLLIIWFIIAICLLPKFQYAIYLLIAALPSYCFTHDYSYLIRRIKSDYQYSRNRNFQSKLSSIRQIINKIIR